MSQHTTDTNTSIYKSAPTIPPERPLPERELSLDLLRVVGLVCVVLTHFFLFTHLTDEPINDFITALSLCLRNIGLLCLTIFMMLTGYLQGNKHIPLRLSYFPKILKFLVPHVLVVATWVAVLSYWHGRHYTVNELFNIFFEFHGHSWYVNMYFGLFLMIPILNIVWQNMRNKRQELILIGIFLVLSILPTVINVYNIGADNWWRSGKINYVHLLPDFWEILYPLAFYFTGAYLKKHRDELCAKFRAWQFLLMFLGVFAVYSAYCIIRNWGELPIVYPWIGRNSFFQYSMGIPLMMFFASFRLSGTPRFLRKFIIKLSDLTYTAYLISYMFDDILYPILRARVENYSDRFMYLPLMVGVITVCSLVAAFFIDLVSRYVFIKPANKLICKIKKSRG